MILVTGATGYTGRFLTDRLLEMGERLRLLVRPSSEVSWLRPGDRIETRVGDLDQPTGLADVFSGVRAVVHLAGIRHAAALTQLIGSDVEQLVITSSLRRFSTVSSASVDAVIEGERRVVESAMPSTILRPSMIFGPGNDRNICRLAARLRRSRWIPVFGTGRHLMQPVFVRDAVEAIVACLGRTNTIGRAYAVAGAEALTYNEVIDATGEAVGVKPMKIHLPHQAALAGLWCAGKVGVGAHFPVTAEQLRRLQEDKAFPISEARADFGYLPLAFKEALRQIYRPNEEEVVVQSGGRGEALVDE